METMRYSETRKPSKGPVIGFFTFVVLGCAFIVFGISLENDPLFGNGSSNVVDGLVNIYEEPLVNIYEEEEVVPTISSFEGITYNVADKTFSDKTNKKIKSNITIPVISIDSVNLDDINKKIEEEYTNRFTGFKETMANAENNFTYKVTYKVYENIVGEKKIVSITIWQRTVDDSTGRSVFDKIDTHNIDVVTKEEVKVESAAKLIIGTDYKTKVKNSVKDYVVKNCGVDETTFIYTMSGLESYYIKDNELHIIINSDTIVDKKYGVLDIVISKD